MPFFLKKKLLNLAHVFQLSSQLMDVIVKPNNKSHQMLQERATKQEGTIKNQRRFKNSRAEKVGLQ